MAKFAVVDINNLYYRAAKATQGDAFTRSGMSLHITFNSLLKLYRQLECDHIVICAEGRSWRYNVFPEYKSKRRLDKAARTASERENDAVLQHALDDLIEFLETKTRVTVLRSENVEGDDFIARFIKLHPQDEHIILSSDSDFIQLIDDNVTIYDAMLDRIITKQGVKNSKGDSLVFDIDSSKAKISIKGTVEEEIEKHRRAQKALAKQKPGHVITAFEWSIDDEWWKRALFMKIIRGDSSDSIFSCYPGARYKGSKNKVGIVDAWNDRVSKGYEWNNFMNQTWQKLKGGVDEEGNPLTEEVTVKDEFEHNRLLIDLTAQPSEIIDEMDAVIVDRIQKEPVQQVGVALLRFCGKHQLARISSEVALHGQYLNAGYPLG